MGPFLKNNQKSVSVGIISFAVGFAFALVLIGIYANREIVGSYCIRTATQAQEYFKSL